MIIKLYTPDNTLHIIENAFLVTAYPKMYSYTGDAYDLDMGGDGVFNLTPFTFWNKASDSKATLCRVIDYDDENSVHRRLVVENRAYICNDSGKTIEKVDSGCHPS